MAPTRSRGARRDQIQAAAQQLFRDKGYLATSMRDIADEMQMKGGGSLYAHIRGKEDLLWDIATEAVKAFFGALEPILAKDLPPVEKLREAMIAHMLVIMSHLGATAVYFDEWRHLGDTRRAEFQAHRDAYERLFQRLIHEGIESGQFRPLDERLATLHVLGSMNAIRRWFRADGRLKAPDLASSIADMLLNGLRKCE
jgi:TetR/AcrR family transcriptional regulator, cholesterol catabolism regulator